MSKKIKVLVACIGDWNTLAIFELIKSIFNIDASIISSASNSKVSKIILKLGVFFNKKIENDKSLYNSFFMKIAFLLFDFFVCANLIFKRPDYLFCWANMSNLSIKLSKYLKCKTILYQGNASLRFDVEHELLTVSSDKWLRNQEEEQISADVILVESEFVKNTIRDIYREKVKVIPTFFDSNMVIKRNTNVNRNKVVFGVTQVNRRKNIGFTLNLVRTYSKLTNKKVELWLFGNVDNDELNKYSSGNDEFSVIKYGYLPKKEYYNLMGQVNIALFPTLSDGGPRALVECIGLGVPVISSKFCIGPDLVEESSGLLSILELDEKIWMTEICNMISSSCCDVSMWKSSKLLKSISEKQYNEIVGLLL